MRLLSYATFGDVCIIIDEVLQRPPWSDLNSNLPITDTEWLWDLFYDLLSEMSKITDGRKHKVRFLDDPLELSFQKIDDNVDISFSTLEGEDIGKTMIPFQDFRREIIETSDKFIETLLEINPNLDDWLLLGKIWAMRKKAEENT